MVNSSSPVRWGFDPALARVPFSAMVGPGTRLGSRVVGRFWMITVSEDNDVDFESTARIATEAFGSKEVVFSPPRMRWLYESGFGQGSAVVGAFYEGRKIGQIVLL